MTTQFLGVVPAGVAEDRHDASRGSGRRLCAWCKGEIAATVRRDALCCSVRCRQARHRFISAVGQAGAVSTGQPRRLAYADPPYPGLSKRYYSDHPDYAGEVDHGALVASLTAEYDAWALSTSAAALPEVLASCPPGVRVAAWHRGERPHSATAYPLNAWEPVIYGGDIRRPALEDASPVDARRLDSLVFHARPRLTDPARVVGAKPATFCRWIFELLGATEGDTLTDVFPGSGGVRRAWEAYGGAGRRVVPSGGRDASRLVEVEGRTGA